MDGRCQSPGIPDQRILSHKLIIFVKLDVQDLPFANADAGMAALMTLVAVMTTKEFHLPLMVDSDFINRKKPKTGTCEL